MPRTMIILYVADQARSRAFYEAVLGRAPILDVPGMTEFPFAGDVGLGLMPEAGIARILGSAVPDPASGSGVPRAELYVPVADPAGAYERLIAAGGTAISEPARRGWGDLVAYGADPDGHVVAFASD